MEFPQVHRCPTGNSVVLIELRQHARQLTSTRAVLSAARSYRTSLSERDDNATNAGPNNPIDGTAAAPALCSDSDNLLTSMDPASLVLDLEITFSSEYV